MKLKTLLVKIEIDQKRLNNKRATQFFSKENQNNNQFLIEIESYEEKTLFIEYYKFSM